MNNDKQHECINTQMTAWDILHYVIRSFVLRAIYTLDRARELTDSLLKNSDYNYSCRNTILRILIFRIGSCWGRSFPNEVSLIAMMCTCSMIKKQINSLL